MKSIYPLTFLFENGKISRAEIVSKYSKYVVLRKISDFTCILLRLHKGLFYRYSYPAGQMHIEIRHVWLLPLAILLELPRMLYRNNNDSLTPNI
jgi:hypothetical protein